MNDTDRDRRVRQMFALFRKAAVTHRDHRLAVMTEIVHRPIDSTNDLSDIELHAVVDVLAYWDRTNELQSRCSHIVVNTRNLDIHQQDEP